MNNFSPTGAATNRFIPSMFLTPQGNVYIVDGALEVANVPMRTGMSVAICPTENLMYLKMYQNGTPTISAYTLAHMSSQLITLISKKSFKISLND